MDLERNNIAHYLCSRGLIASASIVHSDFVAVEAIRRNRTFKIRRTCGQSLFVKQLRTRNLETVSCLAREAQCYEYACQDATFSALAPLMPRFIFYDDQNYVLVLELLSEAQNLRQLYSRSMQFDAEIAGKIGSALATFHVAIKPSEKTSERLGELYKRAPWIFSFHSLNVERGSPGGAIAQLHSLLRRYPTLMDRLSELAGLWRTECWIHGDLRLDNCLVCGHDGGGTPQLKVVDWELAGFGDPCWDVGNVLQGYLSCWIASMPDNGVEPGSMLIECAGCRFENIQPSIRAFWESYRLRQDLYGSSALDFLDRSIRYCAACMVQTVYEVSVDLSHLTPYGIRLLQMADNILSSPHEGIAHLLEL